MCFTFNMVKHPGWRSLALVLWIAVELTLWFAGLALHWPLFAFVLMFAVFLGINVPIAMRRRRRLQAAASSAPESIQLTVPTGFPPLPPGC
jgi:ABC-type proline/glycine betaine transport system permease subunit